MDNVTEWQHPFVDVFKKYDTFDAPKSYKGSVTIIHDPIIARKSFKITGSILSNNTVTIPDPTGELKYSNLIGRYLYIEFLASPQKYFCIHFEIGIKDREPGVRFTLTNMEKQYTIAGGNTLKIPFTSQGRNLWTIACIDIQHHLENFGLFTKGAIKNYPAVHTLRGVQICSNLTIRGIYTSSNVYDWSSLPKQMAFKLIKGGRWQQNYNFIYYPESINPVEIRRKLKQSEVQPPKVFPNSIVERDQASTSKKARNENISSFNESNRPQVGVLPSQSLLQLSTAFSFSSLHNPDIIFKNQKVYYSAGSILVRKDINTGEQLFMQGHTDYIVAMDSHEDWLVSVQEGAKSSVRIWIDHKCICSFQCPYQKVQQIRLSHKKHLVMVGLDTYKRQTVLVFDISEIETTRKPALLAKQISDFNILTIKFSPVESDKLVSCGKENIRFWRVKNQHLPGSPVILNHHARNTIFTVLDFEYFYDDPNPIKQRSEIKRVYVGSQNGLLFQINYATHQLQQVYKLHDNSAISSLLVSSGFCVTGGEDQLLRVWQMDFSEYILQANNDGVVTSLALSEDASEVACGTSTGVLSILDLTNNNYRTIVRSHTQNVLQIVYHPYCNNMITLSSDLTIRLWDLEKLEQTYEFSYPSNDNCLCLAPNPQGLFFAAGFESGTLRIFDIEKTSVSQEIKHHQNPILHIEYTPDGRYLAVLQEKLNMLYSPLHSHQPIKHLPNQIPSKYKHSSFSEDSEVIAIIGDSGTHINLWQLKSLQLLGKIFTGKVVKKLKYEGQRLWVLFEDTSIRRYNTLKMTIQVQMQALHRSKLNAIDFQLDNHLLFSVGDDSFVKVWDYSFLRQPHQVYIGHAKNINDVCYKNGKLWTVGSEGILVWNFKEQEQKFVQPPIFAKEKKATFIKNSQQANSMLQQRQSRLNQQQASNLGQQNLMLETIKGRDRQENAGESKIVFSNLIKKSFDNEVGSKFVPQKVDSVFQPKHTNFKKTKKREGKPKLTVNVPQQNIELNLPLKHICSQQLGECQLEYVRKIEEIKQHSKKYKLQFFMGIEPAAHDHIVWNFMYGWYAYLYDNLIIVESLNKVRSQRIITMPEKLGSLALTNDYKRLICSSVFNSSRKNKVDLGDSASGSDLSASSIQQGQENNTANIYIINSDFSIEKKLEFHPRGIQSMKLSDNGKFIVSIGNFRECTVCVWDFQFGKLKASSYTLDKLNDISIQKTAGEGKLLQFATVGRDQVHFWNFNKDEKLEYYDVFVKGEDQDDQVPQITSCDYLIYHETTYLMFGTNKGELGIINTQTFKTTWRKKVCSAQILVIRCYANITVLGSEDGNVYIWNHNATLLQNQPTPSFNKINLYYSVNGIFADQDGNEGVVTTSQGVYYVNFAQQFHSLLVGAPTSKVIFIKTVNQYLLTSHQNGRLKLWNLETAEELKTYKWKYPCTQAYFDESLGKLVCFCANQTVKLVNLKKFTKQQNYLAEDGKIDGKVDDYVINSSMVAFGGRPSRWVFYSKGNVFSFDIGQDGKKKSIKCDKVLELGYKLTQIVVFPQKNLIIASSSTGTVYSYNVDYMQQAENSFNLLMVDKAPIQQFSLEKKQKIQGANQEEHTVKLALSKVLNQTYLAISFESQCVYFRNYMKRITFQRISLPSFPRSILIQESKRDSEFIVGLKEGGIMKFNTIQTEQRIRYQGIVNNSVDQIAVVKGKNWLVLGHPSAMAIYSPEQ